MIKSSLSDVGLSDSNFAALMSDNVAYMKVAGRLLRETFSPKLLLIYCPCHLLHLVAQAVVKQKKEDLLPLVIPLLTQARSFTILRFVRSLDTVGIIPDWAETRYTAISYHISLLLTCFVDGELYFMLSILFSRTGLCFQESYMSSRKVILPLIEQLHVKRSEISFF